MEKTDAVGSFEGQCFSGEGDREYLQLLDIARRMLGPDPEFQNVTMLYEPAWDGLREGPPWTGWWVQNSYGPTYCALPFYTEPFTTFLQHSQDLWFDQMGDGVTSRGFDKPVGRDPVTQVLKTRRVEWVAPDGCLCDCARPGWIVVKQGDGQIDMHDWPMGFTAAGLVMQAEAVLISRDPVAVAKYLPKLERCANFIETRRDPKNNLFLAGTGANLLAPSYAGWKRPDGTYDKAYLAEISITYIAGLDRLIELEKLAGSAEKAALYRKRRDLARKGLARITTDEGYFIRSLDPDGTRHGVYGAERHAYFESTPNHDAIAFRVVDDAQARRIYAKIASVPGLRPHDLIIPNYPTYDDMYAEQKNIWVFGEWVNGGHWSTCEARMIMAYYRLGQHEDIRRSLRRMLSFARLFHLNNPLSKFGGSVGWPERPTYLSYDAFGPFAAMVRGLFEYRYTAEGVTLVPHIPPGITRLAQHFPVRLGAKRLYLSVSGAGPIRSVRVNGRKWRSFTKDSVLLREQDVPEVARVEILLGEGQPGKAGPVVAAPGLPEVPGPRDPFWEESGITPLKIGQGLPALTDRIRRFYASLAEAGLAGSHEAAHARTALESIATIQKRRRLLAEGKIAPLPPDSQKAAGLSYIETASKLCHGLASALEAHGGSDSAEEQRIHRLWAGSAPGA